MVVGPLMVQAEVHDWQERTFLPPDHALPDARSSRIGAGGDRVRRARACFRGRRYRQASVEPGAGVNDTLVGIARCMCSRGHVAIAAA